MRRRQSETHKGMSTSTAKTSGWAAFDRKQRRSKQEFENEDFEPFPPISSLVNNKVATPATTTDAAAPLSKPFLSVLLPHVNLEGSNNKPGDFKKTLQVNKATVTDGYGKLSELNIDKGKGRVFNDIERLKKRHMWADESLIHDVMVGVNNDVDKALALLEAMVSSSNEKPEAGLSMGEKGLADNAGLAGGSVSGEVAQIAELNSLIEEIYIRSEMNKLSSGSNAAFLPRKEFSGDANGDAAKLVQDIDRFSNIPIEPEWEEDDVYLVQRKDAMRMMRSASRHSKAAADAYMRGDHLAAQHFSLKAREEWMAAEKLNAEAAKEILTIRNCKNDLWTLDLHGLHAAEAVQALQEQLQKIETQVSLTYSNGVLPLSASLESSSGSDVENSGMQLPSFKQQRQKLLQVITGKGNHSRGEAALPTAIRNFLIDNGYHYDEARAGAIAVRPKFRRQ